MRRSVQFLVLMLLVAPITWGCGKKDNKVVTGENVADEIAAAEAEEGEAEDDEQPGEQKGGGGGSNPNEP